LFIIDLIGIGEELFLLKKKEIFFYSFYLLLNSMQQGKMFFIMGLCMALVQGGYVRRIPHGKEITAAMSVSIIDTQLINRSIFVGYY
jgi:hypothetical protein